MDRQHRVAAFVDGELPPADRAAFEREMRDNPELAEDVDRQMRLRMRLAAAYDPILGEPAPPRLALAASAANDAGPRTALSRWATLAACLAAGILIGRVALPERGPVALHDGAILARGELARSLDRRLAAEAGPIRVGLSFRTGSGDYCRTFLSEPDRLAGVACREGERWATRTLSAWDSARRPAYRTAGSETPPEILAAVDMLIAGEPLDAKGEQAARARGWRRPPLP